MCSKSVLEKIKKQIVEDYRNVYGDDLVEVFLFGSYARGDYDEESDIDFAAIVRGERMDIQKKLYQVWDKCDDLGLENDVIISPTVIPYAEFKKYQTILPYYNNIVMEGKKIG